MPRYSVILPVHNGGEYVKKCIGSILAQTIPDFNIHVLDNCSDDGTFEWVSSLKDERVIITRSEKKLSIEENWARILSIPKNEFMTMIGHDDLLHKDYLKQMSGLIEKHPRATLYQTHFRYIGRFDETIRTCQPMKEMQTASEFLECQILRTLDSTGTGYMMRSSDYDSVGGISPHYPNLIFADYELWIRLIAKGYKATSLAEGFSYRIHDSVSRVTNGEQYKNAFGKYILFLNEMKNKNAEFTDVIRKRGKSFLLYFCQALSHRLLKTPLSERKTSVRGFIDECRGHAKLLIPGQRFFPVFKPGIFAALILDNKTGLRFFSVYKKLTAKS